MSDKKKFATRTIHAGQEPDPSTGAIMTPIYATSTYVQESPGVHKGFEYSRTQNPTRMAYERCVADLESGSDGFAFASGMATTATILELVNSGSHVVAMDDLYGGTRRLFSEVRERSAGIEFTYADLSDLDQHVCHTISAKAAGVWLRYRHAFNDEIYQWALRYGWWYSNNQPRAPRKTSRALAEFHRFGGRPVRQFPGVAWREDA
jgi:cystathionine gamma-lyase